MTTDDKTFIDKAIKGLTVRILWVCASGIIVASVGATAWYYTLLSHIQEIVSDNKMQQRDIEDNKGDISDLKIEVRLKADKIDLDNLSVKLDDYSRYRENKPTRR